MRIHQLVITTFVFAVCFLLSSCEDTLVKNTVIISTETISKSNVQPTDIPSLRYRTGRLECTTYYQAQWGDGVGEFGLCPASSRAWVRGPYPPVPDGYGGLFVLDKANQRIVRFHTSKALQVIPLSSSYVLDNVCSDSNQWSNISVSKDRMFLRYLHYSDGRLEERVAVLSLAGEEQGSIDLGPYYPLNSPYLDSLLPDRRGGVYVQFVPVGLVHFDKDFRSTFIFLGTKADYGNMVVGWDGNFYEYDADQDIVRNWGMDNRLLIHGEALGLLKNVIGAAHISPAYYRRLMDVDDEGRLYFSFITYEQGKTIWYLRVSGSGRDGILATLADGENYLSSLAPDGSLYNIVYDPGNPAIRPRIVRCVFRSD